MMGAVFVDAPVSGGINAAAAGTLTFMVSAKTGRYFYQRAALALRWSLGGILVFGGTGMVDIFLGTFCEYRHLQIIKAY